MAPAGSFSGYWLPPINILLRHPFDHHSTPPTSYMIMRTSLAIPFFCLAASITPSFAVSVKYTCLLCSATDVDSIFQI